MSHPLPARRRLVLLVAVLAALALAAGFAWRSTPVPVQNSAYAFACPRSRLGPKPRGPAAPSGWKEPRWGASTATPPSPGRP